MYSSPNQVPPVSGIYALCCPESRQVKYIGQAKNMRARVYSHFRGDGSKTPKSEWIKSLKKKGFTPGIKILEVTDDLNTAEIRHIKEHGLGCLLNVHHGGEYEGRQEPKPWRVIGISCPTKILYMRCKNAGVKREVLDSMSARVKACKSDYDRIRLEMAVASQVSDTDLKEKVSAWAYFAIPRIQSIYPDMI